MCFILRGPYHLLRVKILLLKKKIFFKAKKEDKMHFSMG